MYFYHELIWSITNPTLWYVDDSTSRYVHNMFLHASLLDHLCVLTLSRINSPRTLHCDMQMTLHRDMSMVWDMSQMLFYLELIRHELYIVVCRWLYIVICTWHVLARVLTLSSLRPYFITNQFIMNCTSVICKWLYIVICWWLYIVMRTRHVAHILLSRIDLIYHEPYIVICWWLYIVMCTRHVLACVLTLSSLRPYFITNWYITNSTSWYVEDMLLHASCHIRNSKTLPHNM